MYSLLLMFAFPLMTSLRSMLFSCLQCASASFRIPVLLPWDALFPSGRATRVCIQLCVARSANVGFIAPLPPPDNPMVSAEAAAAASRMRRASGVKDASTSRVPAVVHKPYKIMHSWNLNSDEIADVDWLASGLAGLDTRRCHMDDNAQRGNTIL